MKRIAIDVFGGCGGLSQGIKNAGFEVIASIEKLESARKVYKINHPEVLLFEDIRKIKGVDILRSLKIKKGDLDLLAGCPPCQGFSSMRTKNRKNPVEDERNDLILDFLRLAKDFEPKTILIENVPGLLLDPRLEKVKKELKRLGYYICDGVLNASHFGVPQRRRRMILMASKFAPIALPEPKQINIVTVRKAIGKLKPPKLSKNPLHNLYAQISPEVMKKIKKIPKDGGSRSHLALTDQLPCHAKLIKKNVTGFNDVYGRLSWDKESSTITRFSTNPSKGRFLHPVQDRGLTIYEAAILQSFPKSYKFPIELGIMKLASMIGEALPPLFAKAQAKHLHQHLIKHNGK